MAVSFELMATSCLTPAQQKYQREPAYDALAAIADGCFGNVGIRQRRDDVRRRLFRGSRREHQRRDRALLADEV